jgi:sugar/nucleoside kinase (ribokinase family)
MPDNMREVGCAGILVEDTFCGPLAALPAEGALLALEHMPVYAGGCAANVAIDLAKQDVRAEVSGCVGEDGAAAVIVNALSHRRIGCSGVVRVTHHATAKTIVLLVEGEDRRYLHMPGANRAFSVSHIPQTWVSDLRVFYLGGLFALPGIEFNALATLLKNFRAAGVATIMDVALPDGLRGMTPLKSVLPFVDYFIPNEDEARAFTGVTDPFDQLRAFRSAGANTVIITCGKRGAVAAQGSKLYRCGTYQMNVVDPSGSGDAFTSGVIRGLRLQWDLARTLRYASAVGASATRAIGCTAAVFTAAEAEAFVAGHPLTVTEVT